MDIIDDYVKEKEIKKELVSKYDTIIGGGCLIMKNPRDYKSINPFRYIVLYRELKEEEGNEIDFFLYIKDKKKREDAVNYILENNIWEFFKKINFSYKDEYKQFDYGYIVRSSPEARIESYLKNMNNKLINLKTNIPKRNITTEKLLNALSLGLFQIKPLIFDINNNKDMNFSDFTQKINILIGNNFNNINNYESLLNEIIKKIEISLGYVEEQYYNQAIQYDENKSKKSFMKKYETNKLKYIVIPIEEKITCQK